MPTLAEELAEVTQWDDAPPQNLEEQEIDIIAFELWQRASCAAPVVEDEWLGEEEALRCHASCL